MNARYQNGKWDEPVEYILDFEVIGSHCESQNGRDVRFALARSVTEALERLPGPLGLHLDHHAWVLPHDCRPRVPVGAEKIRCRCGGLGYWSGGTYEYESPCSLCDGSGWRVPGERH